MMLLWLILLRIMRQNNKISRLIGRLLLGGLAVISFVVLFLVSDWQHWPLVRTLVSVIVLVVLVNVGYIWLFWLARRQQLLDEEKDD